MSRVIPNHVLRVGQTICVASQEESRSSHSAGCSCCHSMPIKCSYYSTEDWAGQPPMGQPKRHLLPSGRIYGTSPNAGITHTVSQAPSWEVCSLERPTHQSKGGDATDVSSDSCPVSPTLDISIDDLNQLILEIDPTFQPLSTRSANSSKMSFTQATPGARKQEPDSLDIKYIEMTPTRAKCHESLQGSGSPSVTPLSMSPQSNGILLAPRGIHKDNCNTRGSIIVLNKHGGPPHLLPTGRHSPTCYKASESVSIPQRGQKDCISYGSNSLLPTSPGFDNLLKPLYIGRVQQRASGVSVLSTIPGSDTSYMLGSSCVFSCSSTQSLLNDECDAHPAMSTGSPSSMGSLSSSYTTSSGSGFYHPSAAYCCKAIPSPPPPLQMGHASSCPPSIVNSASDIPILLVNGCLEHSEASAKHSFKQRMPTNSSLSSGIGSLDKTSSESSLSSPLDTLSLAGPSKETQPSMKFVMDTSKYWFKPSITRDQAIQLLKDTEPGTFVVRDSTSYRGSFGLAMKVHGSPYDGDSDLIRHFLIESSAKGVHLKGASEEPYFGSLSAFVYQHAIMSLALPYRLIIPSQGMFLILKEGIPAVLGETWASTCNVLYLCSVSVETLTGVPAIQKAVSSTFELEKLPTPTIVHFKVTEQGVTLTDIQRKVFFRRHYPLAVISFCGMDPENRKWQKFCKSSRIFGLVAKSQRDSENICHLFAEYDAVQPASLVIDFVTRLLPATEKP
uniref:Tensin 4 n=1 Tax=Sphenodon punctatus TaxID=8508 RepID=A0A8D0G9E3_SPHPU